MPSKGGGGKGPGKTSESRTSPKYFNVVPTETTTINPEKCLRRPSSTIKAAISGLSDKDLEALSITPTSVAKS